MSPHLMTVCSGLEAWTPDALALLTSLDAQSLPADRWSLVVAVPPGAETTPPLPAVESHRPNARILTVQGAQHVLPALAALSTDPDAGEWLVLPAVDAWLAPDALAVLAEAMGAAAPSTDALACTLSLPPAPAGVDATAHALAAPVIALRRAWVESHRERLSSPAEDPVTALAAAMPTTVAVERHPVARHGGATGDDPRATGAPGPRATVGWDGTRLRVSVPRSPARPDGPARHTRLVLRDLDHGLVWPFDVEPAGPDPEDRVRGAIDLGPHTAAPPPGRYAVVLQSAAPGATRWNAVALGPDGEHPALLEGRPVAVHDRGGALVVDVGARGRSLLGPVDPAGAVISEDADGTLLRLPLPGLHVVGDGTHGAFVLDTLPVPARIDVADGRATLAGCVSGLPGRAVLSTRFGPGTASRTGLELVFAPGGEVTLRRAGAGRPGTPSGGAAPSTTGPSRRLAARARRRVPGFLEPLVGRVSRVPLLRDAYRALIRE